MIAGVTGGIGAGKSTVCDVFAKAGAWVIEADEVGHETVQDPAVIQNLVEAFGLDIVDKNGVLIRRELGRRAFASEAGRERLNAIVWPPLIERLRDRAGAALEEAPERVVVIDAALLLEWGDAFCDVLVVVAAPLEVRKKRTMDRLGISEAEVEARMASQKPEEEKVRAADYVIQNGDSLEMGRQRAREVWEQIILG